MFIFSVKIRVDVQILSDLSKWTFFLLLNVMPTSRLVIVVWLNEELLLIGEVYFFQNILLWVRMFHPTHNNLNK